MKFRPWRAKHNLENFEINSPWKHALCRTYFAMKNLLKNLCYR